MQHTSAKVVPGLACENGRVGANRGAFVELSLKSYFLPASMSPRLQCKLLIYRFISARDLRDASPKS
jgi:hypothetical protein